MNNAYFKIEIPISHIIGFDILCDEYEVNIIDSKFDEITDVITVKIEDDKEVVYEVLNRCRGVI